jgi:hypothetical protein
MLDIQNSQLKDTAICKICIFLSTVLFHNFEIVPAANDYQAPFPAARRNFGREFHELTRIQFREN